MTVLRYMKEIPDFPKKGVVFKDISPVLVNHFNEFITECADEIADIENIDLFAGVESRGFIIAAAMAEKFQKGFVMIRKAGKLPPPVESEEYLLEYGAAKIEMQNGRGNVCIVDDVLATGGTLTSSCKLAQKCGYNVVDVFVAINLIKMNDFSFNGLKCKSLLES